MLDLTGHIAKKSLLCSFILFIAVCDAAESFADAVDLRIEVSLVNNSCRMFENPTLTMRIVNPNASPVILPDFDIAYNHPMLQVRGPDDEYHKLYYGAHDSARRPPALIIEANSAVEYNRFLYSYYSWERWPNEPGTFAIRGYTRASRCRVAPDDDLTPINWHFPEFLVRVELWRTVDRNGYEFLREELAPDPSDMERAKAPSLFRIRVFSEFLERFGESAYAPEIRWETAKLLLGLDHRTVEREGMSELLEECLTDCLERGGAYAEDFLKWDMERGGSYVFQYVGMHSRHELFDLLVRKLNERYPADDEAKAYRRIMKLVVTEKLDAARAAAEEFRAAFPDSEYRKQIEGAIRTIERRTARKPTENVDP